MRALGEAKEVGEISEDETTHGRPMLSAFAVSTQGAPRSGFYKLAISLGKLKSDVKADELPFWESECQAVYETWKVDVKYNKQ